MPKFWASCWTKYTCKRRKKQKVVLSRIFLNDFQIHFLYQYLIIIISISNSKRRNRSNCFPLPATIISKWNFPNILSFLLLRFLLSYCQWWRSSLLIKLLSLFLFPVLACSYVHMDVCLLMLHIYICEEKLLYLRM